jgi:putative FmdB family regulatory protein
MPIYDYGCEKCGNEFEVEQRITDDPIRTCPKCRSRKVKRLISRTSFVLKGGGWYSDLYASPSAAKQGKDDSGGDDSGGGGKADKKPESKPDAKSGAKSDAPAKSAPKSKGSKAAA